MSNYNLPHTGNWHFVVASRWHILQLCFVKCKKCPNYRPHINHLKISYQDSTVSVISEIHTRHFSVLFRHSFITDNTNFFPYSAGGTFLEMSVFMILLEIICQFELLLKCFFTKYNATYTFCNNFSLWRYFYPWLTIAGKRTLREMLVRMIIMLLMVWRTLEPTVFTLGFFDSTWKCYIKFGETKRTIINM